MTEKSARPPVRLWALPLFALLIVLVWADLLFSHRSFGGRDIRGYSLPIEKAIHDAYGRGRMPVWLADVSGGRPLLANPNSGSLYPVRPLLAALPFPVAMRLFPVLHWILAGFGMILLGRSLDLSAGACWIAAVTYVLSGVSVSEVFYSNYHPGMALLPWLLWTLKRPARPAERILSIAVVFGLLFLAGDIFVCSLALLCALLWIVLEVAAPRQKPDLKSLGLGLVLAALFAAPQLVATALWIPITNRAILGMQLHEALLFSVSPWRLLEYVVPYPFGPSWELGTTNAWGSSVFGEKSVGFFTSFYAGAFAAIGLWVTRREARPGAHFGRVLFVLTIALSVLPSLVPASLGMVRSPIPIRFPEKLAVGTILAVALLAGIALDALRRERRLPRWLLAGAATFALLALVVLLTASGSGRFAVRLLGGEPALASAAAGELPASIAEAGLFWVLTVVGLDLVRKGGRLSIVCGISLLTAVPIAANRRIGPVFREEDVLAPTAFDRFLKKEDPEGRYRTVGESGFRAKSALELAHQSADTGGLGRSVQNWDLFSHVLWGRGTVLQIDFDHGDLSRLESLRGIGSRASTFLDSGPFFSALALRWGIRYRDQVSLGGFGRIRSLGLQEWDENPHARPDLRLLEKWREEPAVLPAAQAMPRLGDGEVVLETEVARDGAARGGQVRVLEKTPETLIVEAEAMDPTWLFVLRGFWPYRQVRVDGVAVEPVPAQIAFSAVPIPAGRHRVEWKEAVPGAEVSRWGPVVSVLAAFGLIIRDRRRGARP